MKENHHEITVNFEIGPTWEEDELKNVDFEKSKEKFFRQVEYILLDIFDEDVETFELYKGKGNQNLNIYNNYPNSPYDAELDVDRTRELEYEIEDLYSSGTWIVEKRS